VEGNLRRRNGGLRLRIVLGEVGNKGLGLRLGAGVQ
jgi:hypothetical protein